MRIKLVWQAALPLPVLACIALAPRAALAEPFSVSVAGLHHGRFAHEQVYSGFGCDGGNVSPRISWAHVPPGTKSLAVNIHDPDAPTGGLGWTHWEVVNIAPSATSLDEGASGDRRRLPAGAIETLTDFGASRYGGPCPPPGEEHRYVVTVSALAVPALDVTAAASPARVAFQMHGKVIARARYVAKYGRAAP